MSHGKKVQRLSPQTDQFKNLSSDILSLILNSLPDRDIFRSVLFLNKLFLNTCYQKYIIRQKVDGINISKFSNAYHIAFRHAIMLDPKKCKKIIELKEKQWPGDYFHGYELKLDFKNLHAYINFEFFMQGKAIIDIKTPLLKTKYSSSEHCNGVIFKNMKGLDMTFTNCEDSNNRHNLDVDEMPKDLEKIRIKNPQLKSDFHQSIVKFNPDKLQSHYYCFDYNKFISLHPKVKEMLLFFDSSTPPGPIVLPSHITRFGIQPLYENKNLTLDLTNANLKELIIWHDKVDDLHKSYYTRLNIKLIPPLSGRIEKLIIKMYEYALIDGWMTHFKQIDHLITYRTQGIDDTQQGDQTGNLIGMTFNDIIIPKMTFIDNYFLTTLTNRTTNFGPLSNIETLEFIRCRFDDTEIMNKCLKAVTFWQIQKNSEGNYGMIKLPDCVEVITITLESMKYISNIPKNLRKVRVGIKNLSDDIDETIRLIREMTKIECEIIFVDYDLYEYKDEVLLSD